MDNSRQLYGAVRKNMAKSERSTGKLEAVRVDDEGKHKREIKTVIEKIEGVYPMTIIPLRDRYNISRIQVVGGHDFSEGSQVPCPHLYPSAVLAPTLDPPPPQINQEINGHTAWSSQP